MYRLGHVPRGDHALFTTEHLHNRHHRGRYATACSSQFVSLMTSPEEVLSRADQMSYSTLDSHSLALCSEVT